MISVPTVCLRSNLLKDYFAEVKPHEHKKWTAEDFPMWLWFIQHSKIKYMKDITTAYRERLGSISHIRDVCKRLHFSEGIYDIVDYYLTTYPGVKNESKIRARYYSAMISMYFLTKSWEGIKKSAKIFYHSNDWLNLFWIGITLPFFYSPYLIRASYCVRGEVFNLFNIYPIKK